VPLREFAAECAQREEDYSLLDHLYTCAREHLLLNLSPGFFEEALDDGRCLVCLDGLDEVWAVGQRKSVRDAVKALAARYPRSRYLVTSRIVGYGEAPLDRRDFTHHTILPFEDDDIRDFVRKWYEARERDPVQRKQKADDLIGTIEREPRIRSLAQNPLLLTIIALVHRIEAELPHERVKLYDKCVTALVETWEEVKGLSLEEKQRPFYRYRRRLLERLAYELHAGAEEPGQLQTVKEGDLKLLLGQFLMEYKRLGFAEDPDGARHEARAFIHLARGRTGLLVERGEGVFGFPHLTFQEYLAACDIENRCIHRGVDAIWEEIQPRLHDPHWREVILLLLGGLNKYDEPPTLLVERILEAGQDDKFEPVLHRHLYLAARALADRVDVADDLRRRVVDTLLAIACNAPWWEQRDAVTAFSGLEGDRYAAESLLMLIRDPKMEAGVRVAAAEAIRQLGRAKEAAEMLLALVRDPEVQVEVRSTAAFALGQLGRAEEAVEVLLVLVRDLEVEVEVRSAAAFALRQLGRAEEAAEVLLALARDSQVGTVWRSVAALPLEQLGYAEEATEELLVMACDPRVWAVERSVAAWILGQLGRAEEKVIQILLGLVRDKKVEAMVRLEAAEALGQLGHAEEAAEILLALARDEKVEAWVRRNVALALGQLERADEKVLNSLLALVRDPEVDAGVRSAAAEALGELGQAKEKVLDSLLALAGNPEVEDKARSAAAEALGQLGRTEEAGEILLTLARDEEVDAEVRRAAASALGQLGRAKEAGEMLLGLARDEEVDDEVRGAAYESLKRLVGVAMD